MDNVRRVFNAVNEELFPDSILRPSIMTRYLSYSK